MKCGQKKRILFVNLISLYIKGNNKLSHGVMANKPVPVGIARTRPRFDGESPH